MSNWQNTDFDAVFDAAETLLKATQNPMYDKLIVSRNWVAPGPNGFIVKTIDGQAINVHIERVPTRQKG